MLRHLLLSWRDAAFISSVDYFIYNSSHVPKLPGAVNYNEDYSLYYAVKLELVSHLIHKPVFDLECYETTLMKEPVINQIVEWNSRYEYLSVKVKDFESKWKFPR